MDTAFQLFKEHQLANFPEAYRGIEVKGIHLVMLDADTAGCIDAFYGKSGKGKALDRKRHEILSRCRTELKIVIGELQGYPREYFQRLLVICDAVLLELQKN